MTKKVATALIMSQMYAGFLGERKEPCYKANWEPVRMKGLSAEQMGTANSRKKSRRNRKKNRRKKNV